MTFIQLAPCSRRN